MKTSPGFHPSILSDPPFRGFSRSVNPYGGRVLRMFEALCIQQRETAPRAAAICFGTWQQTTFAERAVRAARTAAVAPLRRTSPVTAIVSRGGARTRSGFGRLLSRLGFGPA